MANLERITPWVRRPAVLWPVAALIAVALAVLGVVLYARDPGVGTDDGFSHGGWSDGPWGPP